MMAKEIVLLLLLFFVTLIGVAQPPSFRLSQKHVVAIENIRSAERKLKLYKAYFHRDSIRFAKSMKRYYKMQADSMTRFIKLREGKLKHQDVSQKVQKKIYEGWAEKRTAVHQQWISLHSYGLSLSGQKVLVASIKFYYLEAAQNDSFLFALTQRVPSLKLPRQLSTQLERYKAVNHERLPNLKSLAQGNLGKGRLDELSPLKNKIDGYTGDLTKLKNLSRNISGIDTARSFALNQGKEFVLQQASRIDGFEGVDSFKKYMGQANLPKAEMERYKNELQKMQDTLYVKDQAKKIAKDIVADYMGDHPEVMREIQRKASLLMKKYSFVPNSNDLRTAIKRTSLKGKSFSQRLYVAGNLQVISIDPFSIDFSPMIGYRFNTRFVMGVGGTYRQTFSDTIATLSSEVFGYKVFASYDVLNSFFAYSEFDRNSPGVEQQEGVSHRVWKSAALLGVGRKFSISPKIEMTVVLMYNFLHERPDLIYSRPWVVRVGFQSSQLAFLKKRP